MTASNTHARLLGFYRFAVPAIDSALVLAWSARGLTHALWHDAHDAGLPAEIPASTAQLELPAEYRAALERYFAGEAIDLTALPIELAGTPFQLRVWEALRRIPRGQVRSYAAIAADVGQPRAMRAVGLANGRNPLAVIVPCHRVVEKNHQLGGYSSGLARKRYLLGLEGVEISGDSVRPGQLVLL